MTSLNTLPIPRVHPAAPAHEHAWLVESRHPTSEGIVLYVRCSACDTRRVDLQAHPHPPCPPVRKGMLDRIRDQLIDDQRTRNRRLDAKDDIVQRGFAGTARAAPRPGSPGRRGRQ